MIKTLWFCRWCAKLYIPRQEGPRDGFCCLAHKQAHHRAYKKYVTSLNRYRRQQLTRRVTQKKKKLKKK